MTRDILQSSRDSYQKMLWTSEYSNFQVENYNSHESVSMNAFLWLPLWYGVYVCMCVHIEMLLVCLRLCLNVVSLIPLVAGWFFTSQPWLMRSWTDKQWKWRRRRALMKIPDPLLGFCCCVFIILKHKMQIFTTCLFLPSPYSAMWETPCGHCYSGLWDFSQHPSWSSRWHQPQIPSALAWKTLRKTRRTIQLAQPTHRTRRKNKMAMLSNYFEVTYHAIIGKQNRLQTQFFHYMSC